MGLGAGGWDRVVIDGEAWALRRWPQRSAGPTIVALHGFAGAGEDFAPVIAGPAALGGAWITVEILGHGRSAAPRGSAAYAMPRVAAALRRLLAAAVTPPYVLLGYSMGGRLALELLLGDGEGEPKGEENEAHPWPRPEGLIVVGATPGIRDPEVRAARRREDEALAAAILGRGLPWFADYWEKRPILAGKRRIDRAHRAAMASRLLTQRPWGLAGSLRGMGTGAMDPLWGRLAALEVPTLMISGAEDLKFTAIAAEAAELAPAITHRVIPGVGHTAHLEDPAAFVALAQGLRPGTG